MDMRSYHDAVTAAWKFLHRHLENLKGTDEWWNDVMKEAAAAIAPFKETDAKDFALALMTTALDEVSQAGRVKNGMPRAAPSMVSITYGSLEEAVNRIRAAEGLTEISYTDRGGRRKVIVNIREENHDT